MGLRMICGNGLSIIGVRLSAASRGSQLDQLGRCVLRGHAPSGENRTWFDPGNTPVSNEDGELGIVARCSIDDAEFDHPPSSRLFNSSRKFSRADRGSGAFQRNPSINTPHAEIA